MAEANPFEVVAEQVTAEKPTVVDSYGPVGRLRSVFWMLGGTAIGMLPAVATTMFIPGLFAVLALPLFAIWLVFVVGIVAARLRNAGWTTAWRIVPTGLLVPAIFISFIQPGFPIAAATSLLMAINLPVLAACLIAPTAWTQHKTFDLPARLVAALILLLLVLVLLSWLQTP
jgi:hypothetical protein